jgi:hypothetical protein
MICPRENIMETKTQSSMDQGRGKEHQILPSIHGG